jgi:type II restriction enzyme
MNLRLPIQHAKGYRSAAQIARVVSEGWIEDNLYCLACPSDSLKKEVANAQTLDFRCVKCETLYEAKSSANPYSSRIPDGAHAAMMRTMKEGRTPNFLTLHYDKISWTVANLAVIPGFAVTPSAIHCRKPLAETARRAGWIGCDIILRHIPADARVSIVQEHRPAPKRTVREQFARLKPLAQLSLPQRGWTLNVLNVVRNLKKQEFTLAEVQRHAPELRELHPKNEHVEAKVRQQLQVLRDMGFLTFVNNRGVYRLR